ncbi:hypothetical protein KCV06_g539, partial [Aureobasidium melanogenum]
MEDEGVTGRDNAVLSWCWARMSICKPSLIQSELVSAKKCIPGAFPFVLSDSVGYRRGCYAGHTNIK